MIIKARVLSDMHVGSIYGICPKKYQFKKVNAYQDWVLKCWEEMAKREKASPSDYIYLLGDLVDGEAAKDSSKLCIPDLQAQGQACVELIRPLVGPNTKVIGVDGTRYHDKNIARTITNALDGYHSSVFAVLDLKKYGMPGIQFHHKSANIPATEARRMGVRAKCQPNMPDIGMKVSGHLHRYTYLHQNGIKIIHAPCWEYETDFMGFSEGFDIGSIYIEIDTVKKRISVIDEDIFPVPTDVFREMQGWHRPTDDEVARMEERYKRKRQEETMAWLKCNTPQYERSRPMVKTDKPKKK